MKRFVTLMLLMAAVSMLSAKSVVFTLKDGTLVYYLLGGEKNPVMRFTEDEVVVNADNYEFSDIKNFYISDEDDPAITAIAATRLDGKRFDGNILFLPVKSAGVKVYDASGKEVKVNVSTSDSGSTIDLSALRTGMYVVRVGDSSIKIQKR